YQSECHTHSAFTGRGKMAFVPGKPNSRRRRPHCKMVKDIVLAAIATMDSSLLVFDFPGHEIRRCYRFHCEADPLHREYRPRKRREPGKEKFIFFRAKKCMQTLYRWRW